MLSVCFCKQRVLFVQQRKSSLYRRYFIVDESDKEKNYILKQFCFYYRESLDRYYIFIFIWGYLGICYKQVNDIKIMDIIFDYIFYFFDI